MPVCNMCGDFTENLESHNFYFHRITQKTTDRINQVRVPDQLHYANYSNPARLQAQQYSWPTPPSSNEKNSQSSAAIGLLDELQHEPPNGSLRQCARPTIAFGEQLFRQPSQLQYFKPRTPPGRDREIFSQCPSVSSIPDTLIDGSVAAVGKVGNTLLQEGDRRHTKKLEKIWRIECRKTVDLQSQIQILKADLKTAEETIDELREKLSEYETENKAVNVTDHKPIPANVLGNDLRLKNTGRLVGVGQDNQANGSVNYDVNLNSKLLDCGTGLLEKTTTMVEHDNGHEEIEVGPSSSGSETSSLSSLLGKEIANENFSERLMAVLKESNKIPYGGKLTKDNKNIHLSNTCAIDNQLFILHVLDRFNDDFGTIIANMDSEKIRIGIKLNQVLKLLNLRKFAKAKFIAITKILKLKNFNVYGSEEDFIFRLNSEYFGTFQQILCCPTCNTKSEIVVSVVDILKERPATNTKTLPDLLNNGSDYSSHTCKNCVQKSKLGLSFVVSDDLPPPLFITFPLNKGSQDISGETLYNEVEILVFNSSPQMEFDALGNTFRKYRQNRRKTPSMVSTVYLLRDIKKMPDLIMEEHESSAIMITNVSSINPQACNVTGTSQEGVEMNEIGMEEFEMEEIDMGIQHVSNTLEFSQADTAQAGTSKSLKPNENEGKELMELYQGVMIDNEKYTDCTADLMKTAGVLAKGLIRILEPHSLGWWKNATYCPGTARNKKLNLVKLENKNAVIEHLVELDKKRRSEANKQKNCNNKGLQLVKLRGDEETEEEFRNRIAISLYGVIQTAKRTKGTKKRKKKAIWK